MEDSHKKLTREERRLLWKMPKRRNGKKTRPIINMLPGSVGFGTCI